MMRKIIFFIIIMITLLTLLCNALYSQGYNCIIYDGCDDKGRIRLDRINSDYGPRYVDAKAQGSGKPPSSFHPGIDLSCRIQEGKGWPAYALPLYAIEDGWLWTMTRGSVNTGDGIVKLSQVSPLEGEKIANWEYTHLLFMNWLTGITEIKIQDNNNEPYWMTYTVKEGGTDKFLFTITDINHYPGNLSPSKLKEIAEGVSKLTNLKWSDKEGVEIKKFSHKGALGYYVDVKVFDSKGASLPIPLLFLDLNKKLLFLDLKSNIKVVRENKSKRLGIYRVCNNGKSKCEYHLLINSSVKKLINPSGKDINVKAGDEIGKMPLIDKSEETISVKAGIGGQISKIFDIEEIRIGNNLYPFLGFSPTQIEKYTPKITFSDAKSKLESHIGEINKKQPSKTIKPPTDQMLNSGKYKGDELFKRLYKIWTSLSDGYPVRVEKGEIIGFVAGTGRNNELCYPAHLHLSMSSDTVTRNGLNWSVTKRARIHNFARSQQRISFLEYEEWDAPQPKIENFAIVVRENNKLYKIGKDKNDLYEIKAQDLNNYNYRLRIHVNTGKQGDFAKLLINGKVIVDWASSAFSQDIEISKLIDVASSVTDEKGQTIYEYLEFDKLTPEAIFKTMPNSTQLENFYTEEYNPGPYTFFRVPDAGKWDGQDVFSICLKGLLRDATTGNKIQLKIQVLDCKDNKSKEENLTLVIK